jgi:undecaprenyl-diphosphatase
MCVSRTPATEFSFFLSVPVMFGASLLKLIKAGFAFNAVQWVYLIMGMVIAYVVSLYCINFLMQYIRRHDFRIFGWYRIVLGIIVLLWFAVRMLLGTA